MRDQSDHHRPETATAAAARVWRTICSFLLTSVGLTTVYFFVVIWPDPDKWSSNATANGFLLSSTAIAAVVFGLPTWVVIQRILTALRIPRDRGGEQQEDRVSRP